MADDGAPVIQSIIDTFERRAVRRQMGAYGFLALMLVGIGAAAYVFIQAKEITDRETKGDIPAKIAYVKQNIKENTHIQQEMESSLFIMLMKMLHELPTKENCKNSWQIGLPLVEIRHLFFLDGKLQSKLSVVKKVSSFAHDTECITFLYPNEPPANIDWYQLQTAPDGKWDNPDPSSLELDLEKIEHQGVIYEKALETLQTALERQEIAPLVGEPETQKTPVAAAPVFWTVG
jgi:hypothetical protein